MVYSDGMSYYYAYATGIKTGSHDQAGYCIVASATYGGYTYIVACLGSPSVDSNVHGEMLDAASLFRWVFLNLSSKTITSQGRTHPWTTPGRRIPSSWRRGRTCP